MAPGSREHDHDDMWQMIRTDPSIAFAELERVVVPDATEGLPMEKHEVVARLVHDFLAGGQ